MILEQRIGLIKRVQSYGVRFSAGLTVAGDVDHRYYCDHSWRKSVFAVCKARTCRYVFEAWVFEHNASYESTSILGICEVLTFLRRILFLRRPDLLDCELLLMGYLDVQILVSGMEEWLEKVDILVEIAKVP